VTATANGTIEGLEIPLDAARIARAKKAYATRFVAEHLDSDARGYRLLTGPRAAPAPGDVVLAKVERIGQLQRLEGPWSRRQVLFAGDEIVVAYANRYAPDHVLAEVPADLGPCHLIAAGGLAGTVTASHGSLGRPTQLTPIGLLADGAGRVNLRRFAPRTPDPAASAQVGPQVIAVAGTSMNAGKSTVAACFVRGLANAGLRVAAGKITGTGAGGDPRLFEDAGAVSVLDFTDFGYPSTFRLRIEELRVLAASLVNALAESGPDVIVIEIADGIYQAETKRLLHDPLLHGMTTTVLFAAHDALGASAGVAALREAGLEPAAVSGVLTASPLATAEAAEALDVPVVATYELTEAPAALRLLASTAS
jgi:hypothetical protein